MSKNKTKVSKGIQFRPCYLCGETVNFVLWEEETKRRSKKIWHWANEDGSHHVHKISELTSEQRHLNSIMEE